MSCKSTQQKVNQEQKPIQIETEFPQPFDENGKAIVTLENNETVTMPLWYWLKITEYVIDVEANKELQELNNENIWTRNQKDKKRHN